MAVLGPPTVVFLPSRKGIKGVCSEPPHTHTTHNDVSSDTSLFIKAGKVETDKQEGCLPVPAAQGDKFKVTPSRRPNSSDVEKIQEINHPELRQ